MGTRSGKWFRVLDADGNEVRNVFQLDKLEAERARVHYYVTNEDGTIKTQRFGRVLVPERANVIMSGVRVEWM